MPEPLLRVLWHMRFVDPSTGHATQEMQLTFNRYFEQVISNSDLVTAQAGRIDELESRLSALTQIVEANNL